MMAPQQASSLARTSRHTKTHHFCTTSDGWRLHMVRTVKEGNTLARLHPVVLIPGLGSSGVYTFDLSPDVSLADYLAEQGWDVWVVELRELSMWTGHGRPAVRTHVGSSRPKFLISKQPTPSFSLYAAVFKHLRVRRVLPSGPAPQLQASAAKAPQLLGLDLASIKGVLTSLHTNEAYSTRVLAVAAGAGVLLGCLGPSDPTLGEFSALSSSMGWLYFLSWSLSFWPQLLENWRRQSVEGLSADFIVYHGAGYVAYFLYTYFLLFNPDVRGAYALENAGAAPEIQLSDVCFAAHGFLIMLLTFWQYCTYSKDVGMSDTCKGFVLSLAAISVGYWQLLHGGTGADDPVSTLHFLYFMGSVKLVLTFMSYLPQAVLNAQRRSTEGFHISQVLLDISGGCLSMLQVAIHCVVCSSWSEVTASPAKFLLGGCSIMFDLVFLTQHYVLYAEDKQPSEQLQPQLVRSTTSSRKSRSS